jgi:uncharacterized protein DUF2845
MKTVAYLLLAVLGFLQLPASVDAQQTGSMSCRNGIVSINDTIPDVVKKCGPPAFHDRREETRSGDKRHGPFEIITVDDWTYNFGPQEFMYEVTFHNGRVAKIESLDHGY